MAAISSVSAASPTRPGASMGGIQRAASASMPSSRARSTSFLARFPLALPHGMHAGVEDGKPFGAVRRLAEDLDRDAGAHGMAGDGKPLRRHGQDGPRHGGNRVVAEEMRHADVMAGGQGLRPARARRRRRTAILVAETPLGVGSSRVLEQGGFTMGGGRASTALCRVR